MSGQADETLVSGTLVIGSDIPPFRNGTAHVRLEDISYADAAAPVIAEATIPNVSHTERGRETTIPFSLLRSPSTPAIDERNDYAVRAWVERDNGKNEEADDLYSEQSYRVLTRGFGNNATITLGFH
jgi:uncharacterized lipoprotein YbaY